MKKTEMRLVSAAAIMASLFCCSTLSMAQSGIDSLNNGGTLGGDTKSIETDIKRVGGDVPASNLAADSQPEYYTLSGQRTQTPRRGDIYIIRWRENGAWRESKYMIR